MEDDFKREKILDKITKTMELGTNNSNENEAQTAILAAQKLMAKYHIAKEDVDKFIDEKADDDDKIIEEKTEKETNYEKWKRILMKVLAENFRCDCYLENKKMIIVGTQEDIDIVKRVYLYSKKAIFSNFKTYLKANYSDFPLTITQRNQLKRDYAYGFIVGLEEKFDKQKNDSELALVVVNPKVEEYFNQINFSREYKNRDTVIKNGRCFTDGKQKGYELADIDTAILD